MRYIQIPAPIRLRDLMTDEVTDRTYTFKEFMGQMLMDLKWGKTAADIFVASDIRQKFKDVEWASGAVVDLSDAEWERLSGVIKEPSSPYAPVLVVQVTDFLRAVTDAPSKKPEAKS
jgi:hypothetical protein